MSLVRKNRNIRSRPRGGLAPAAAPAPALGATWTGTQAVLTLPPAGAHVTMAVIVYDATSISGGLTAFDNYSTPYSVTLPASSHHVFITIIAYEAANANPTALGTARVFTAPA
jgi:hypothetical protein